MRWYRAWLVLRNPWATQPPPGTVMVVAAAPDGVKVQVPASDITVSPVARGAGQAPPPPPPLPPVAAPPLPPDPAAPAPPAAPPALPSRPPLPPPVAVTPPAPGLPPPERPPDPVPPPRPVEPPVPAPAPAPPVAPPVPVAPGEELDEPLPQAATVANMPEMKRIRSGARDFIAPYCPTGPDFVSFVAGLRAGRGQATPT